MPETGDDFKKFLLEAEIKAAAKEIRKKMGIEEEGLKENEAKEHH